MTGAEVLRAAIPQLKDAGVPDAARDARLLLAHALEVGVDRLTMALHDPVSPQAEATFEAAVQKRRARKPVSQIIGKRAFWGRDFEVTADVLDPRPDTEALIAACLANPFERVLDLGTGSGAIVLTLLAERPQATGVGVDLSPAALAVAQRNAQRLGVVDRVEMAVSDWFNTVVGSFDLIVSNPPYISDDEMAALSPEVRLHEPHLALTPGGDGLAAYRILTSQAPGHLTPKGVLRMEIGPTQADAVRRMLAEAGFTDLETAPDLDGRDRVVSGVWPG